MKTRLRQLLRALRETFWLVPAAMVVSGVFGALFVLRLDRGGMVPIWLVESPLLYSGGGTGARTLLGAVASSTIGVAGTVFSITIAALSLAAGQMGPSLLRNFTSDRGNQLTLGAFLGTFSYCLMVLRTIRTQSEGAFIPHLALSVGILLAFVCVGTLVFFVGHMAGRINVATVIGIVSADLQQAIPHLTSDAEQPAPPEPAFWRDAVAVVDRRQGYMQDLELERLADWAARHDTAVRMLVRPGDFVFPHTPIALMTKAVEGAEEAIRERSTLGSHRVSSSDPDFAIGQLVEVAVRALSPGINDPRTAMTVIDRLGATLCGLAESRLSTGVFVRDGKPVLVLPTMSYGSLVDVMFGLIRQNAADSAAVLGQLLKTMVVLMAAETDPSRCDVLAHHADLVLADAERTIDTPADLDGIRGLHADFCAVRRLGYVAFVRDRES